MERHFAGKASTVITSVAVTSLSAWKKAAHTVRSAAPRLRPRVRTRRCRTVSTSVSSEHVHCRATPTRVWVVAFVAETRAKQACQFDVPRNDADHGRDASSVHANAATASSNRRNAPVSTAKPAHQSHNSGNVDQVVLCTKHAGCGSFTFFPHCRVVRR